MLCEECHRGFNTPCNHDRNSTKKIGLIGATILRPGYMAPTATQSLGTDLISRMHVPQDCIPSPHGLARNNYQSHRAFPLLHYYHTSPPVLFTVPILGSFTYITTAISIAPQPQHPSHLNSKQCLPSGRSYCPSPSSALSPPQALPLPPPPPSPPPPS